MTITKDMLVEHLVNELGVNGREAKDFVAQFFNEIVSQLAHGRQVKLSGFGNFYVRVKKPRPGRNPKTGESIPITARSVVTFLPGQKLRATIADDERAAG